MNRSIQFWGLFSREVRRYFKVPLQTLGAPIVGTSLYLLIFGISLGGSIHVQENVPYLAFLIPGLIAMSIIKNAFDNSTSAIVGPKYTNEMQDLRTTPFSINQISFAKTLASLSRGILVGVITYSVGQLFYYLRLDSFMEITHWGSLFFFIVFGGMAFGQLGIAIGMWASSFEYIGAVSMLVLLPLIYLGGVFFDLQNAHHFWQFVSHMNPLFYIINGIRYGILGQADVNMTLAVFVTLAFFLITYVLSLLSLRKGSHYLR